jgi:RHS repeat-associated protein
VENSAAYSYSAADGRIAQISNPLIPNQLFNYSYLPSSDLLSAVSGPIHTVTNTYEPDRDLLDIKQNKVGTSIISSYDYAVNAIGQRTGVATSGTAFPAVPSWAWSYDSLGQVIRADSNVNTRDRAYQYDAIGNRQKTANSLTLPVANNYSANPLNQYSAITNSQSTILNPSYDLDGNATAYPLPISPITNSTLTWDAENRLISSTVGTAITTYQYDAQSRRIAKTAGTATTSVATLYLYDAWNCIADYSRSAGVSPTFTLKKTRLWGTDLSGTPQGAGGVAGLLSESLISNPQSPIYYPTYDGNGNVSEYLTNTGTTAAHFEYDPFGNTVVNTDTANLFTYRFSTKPRDSETGLYYYGYRYYDPSTGRWVSRDPIEERGGLNMYVMIRNNTINLLDILGFGFMKLVPGGGGWQYRFDRGAGGGDPDHIQYRNPEGKNVARRSYRNGSQKPHGEGKGGINKDVPKDIVKRATNAAKKKWRDNKDKNDKDKDKSDDDDPPSPPGLCPEEQTQMDELQKKLEESIKESAKQADIVAAAALIARVATALLTAEEIAVAL